MIRPFLVMICACSATSGYPAARRSGVVDTVHGEAVADPYRWLEELASPETRRWVAAQQAFTKHRFATIPGREAIARELAAINDFERMSSPKRRGGKWFYSRSAVPRRSCCTSRRMPATAVRRRSAHA